MVDISKVRYHVIGGSLPEEVDRTGPRKLAANTRKTLKGIVLLKRLLLFDHPPGWFAKHHAIGEGYGRRSHAQLVDVRLAPVVRRPELVVLLVSDETAHHSRFVEGEEIAGRNRSQPHARRLPGPPTTDRWRMNVQHAQDANT